MNGRVLCCAVACVLCRSYDAVAPFIHEWSYEAMMHDLVQMDGTVYRCALPCRTACMCACIHTCVRVCVWGEGLMAWHACLSGPVGLSAQRLHGCAASSAPSAPC